MTILFRKGNLGVIGLSSTTLIVFLLTVLFTNTTSVVEDDFPFFVHGMSMSMTNNNSKTKTPSTMMTTNRHPFKIIDSHLHVWGNSHAAVSEYPYATDQTPPEALREVADVDALLFHLEQNHVDGAVIVQPINYQYDHSYVVKEALQKYPTKFKGMLLHDPSLLETETAIRRLEELTLQGFVGVRYNPYLWPASPEAAATAKDGLSKMKTTPMSSSPSGLAVYKRCGQLKMPVGVMCFKGLEFHLDDITNLLESSPTTTMILDHFSFTRLGSSDSDDRTRDTTDTNNSNNTNKKNDDEEVIFQQLLALGTKYPQLVIKISAMFRLNDPDGYPYERVRTERFVPLLAVFGPERLMFGTDFPFVLEQPGSYKAHIDLFTSVWLRDESQVTKQLIMGGTAERLFGQWG